MRQFVVRTLDAATLLLTLVLCAGTAAAEPTEAELSRRLADFEHDTAHRSALAGALGKAKRALDRARRSPAGAAWAPSERTTDRQAALLRALAARWLDVARDLVRAVDAEKATNEALKALDDVETKVVRGKALLEETIARRGRTQAQLDAVDRPKAPTAPATPPGPTAAPPASAAPAGKSAPAGKAPAGKAPGATEKPEPRE